MTKIVKEVRASYTAKDADAGFAFSNIDSGYGATNRYVTLNGKPIIVISGEMHFSRYDRKYWETEILKMKAGGLNCIATYVFWNHHERKCGVFDFEGNNDVAAFVGLCKKCGMKVILRIGPWCHGEVKRGGFPDYLAFVAGKRRSTPLYLYFVKRFWRALAQQVKEFCDGETVIGIQLENEYGGSINHIVKLREAAEEAGFKTPFFTMTAWPTNTPDVRFLPTFGGYPEAPWTQNKKPLAPCGRFAITEGRSEVAIGEDLLGEIHTGADFSAFPYALCETGTGNQVTQHRRPVISENDGYGVAFAKLASGAVWLGYYMYHGGRNPQDKPMQESRRTFYPNDYPIVDYDFQAPISKDGEVRGHADRLRLMHIFLSQNEESFARTQTFFSKDRQMPYFSFRGDEKGGYVFLSNYERGLKVKEETVDIAIEAQSYSLNIPSLKVDAEDMFFFPVMQEYGGIKFDYITAQPIVVLKEGKDTHAYFVEYGCGVRLKKDGAEETVDSVKKVYKTADGTLTMHFLPLEEAKKLYVFSGKALFSEFPLYEKEGKIYCEKKTQLPLSTVRINVSERKNLPYSSYMFSSGKRGYYSITADNKELEDGDIEITLAMKGLNLQLFKEKRIVDDYFNTDGNFVFRLARVADKDKKESNFIARICAATGHGSGKVYNEINIQPDEIGLFVRSVKKIKTEKVKL